MAAKPAFTNEAIALTEKKIDMTLDDIVKMSKKPASKGKNTRIMNKNRGLINKGTSHMRASQLKQFSDSRANLRQGVLAQRRSNFKANSQFPFAVEAARKVANESVRMRVSNWKKTRPIPVAQRKVGQVFFLLSCQGGAAIEHSKGEASDSGLVVCKLEGAKANKS